jgi:hypothetical protein
MNRAITGLAAAVAAAAGLGCVASPTHASPTAGDVCPPGNGGFVLWDVRTEPYGVDNLVDAAGNNDGWACARPIYVVTDENGDPFQIYNFIDNHFA